jgi:hypothetical protein
VIPRANEAHPLDVFHENQCQTIEVHFSLPDFNARPESHKLWNDSVSSNFASNDEVGFGFGNDRPLCNPGSSSLCCCYVSDTIAIISSVMI